MKHSVILYSTRVRLKKFDCVLPNYDLFSIMVSELVFCIMVCVLAQTIMQRKILFRDCFAYALRQKV